MFDDINIDQDYEPDLAKHHSSSSYDQNMESSDQHKTNSDIKERKSVWKETNWKKDCAKYLRSHGKSISEKRNLQN
jgi:hypothetical protein